MPAKVLLEHVFRLEIEIIRKWCSPRIFPPGSPSQIIALTENYNYANCELKGKNCLVLTVMIGDGINLFIGLSSLETESEYLLLH